MIQVDIYEPDEMLRLLNQVTTAVKSPLNLNHLSDYFFDGYGDRTFQFSRKQAGELVGDLDEAEDQIRDYYPNADRNYQIIEGIISPTRLYMQGKAVGITEHSFQSKHISTRDLGARLFCYQVEPSGYMQHGHSFHAISESMFHAWIHRLAEAGIPTYYTVTWVGTAKLLSAIYNNEQKPPDKHDTLKRIIIPKLILTDPNPMVKTIMYLSRANKLDIGEVKAKAIASRYHSLLQLAVADPYELCQCDGIGMVIANKLVEAVRGD